MYYSGIDLHSDNCYITTIDDSGAVDKRQRVENSNDLVLDYFHSLPGPHQAVVESTTGWYWLNDLLGNHGIELILAHAKYLKAISYAKVKTDKVDSQTLAILLRQGLIPRAHKISRELRGLRDTMRIRLRLVQQRTACLLRRMKSPLFERLFSVASFKLDPSDSSVIERMTVIRLIANFNRMVSK